MDDISRKYFHGLTDDEKICLIFMILGYGQEGLKKFLETKMGGEIKMQRLTKRMEDGSYQANQDDLNIPGENSYDYKNLVIEKLGKYEDVCADPELLKELGFCCCVEK